MEKIHNWEIMSENVNKLNSRKKNRKSFPRLIFISFLAILCILCVASILGFRLINNFVESEFGPPSPGLTKLQNTLYTLQIFVSRKNLTTPVSTDGLPISFNINVDESLQSIARRLERTGVIPDAGIFITYLAYSGMDSTVQAGQYEFGTSLSPKEIAMQLQDATPGEIPFSLLAGWRIEEVAEALVVYGLLEDTEEFLKLALNPIGFSLPDSWPDDQGVEGLLFPGVYAIPRDSSPGEILSLFLERFLDEVDPNLIEKFRKQDLSLYQAVTLASIVEKEAVQVDEQPLISSVFLNRLAIGNKMESDPTIQYALGYIQDQQTWWKNPLTTTDLMVNSPYNTYLVNGLPPTPISSPGLAALQAVGSPPTSEYFFFRAKCDQSGYHNFSRTFAEHLEYACK